MYIHKNVTFFTNISQTNVQSILKAEQRYIYFWYCT